MPMSSMDRVYKLLNKSFKTTKAQRNTIKAVKTPKDPKNAAVQKMKRAAARYNLNPTKENAA